MLKHSKKLISIPETEYTALLALLADPIKAEKMQTSNKISNVLSNPRLNAVEKNVKYNALFKKRKKLAKLIESKPQKIMLEAEKERPLPTSGITPANRPENNVQDEQQQQQQQQAIEVPDNLQEEEAQPRTPRATKSGIEKYESVIDDKFYFRLKNLVDENKDKYGINAKGEVIPNKRIHWEPILDSDYKVVLKYLTGRQKELNGLEKRAAKVLITRLTKDDDIKELIQQSKQQQEGQGKKRYMRALKERKTLVSKKTSKGLIRVKFRPQLWTKAEG